jgi:hypothetical protein
VTTSTEGGRVIALISELAPEAQKRVWVMAQILRDLIDKSGWEAELAFTLVMAELSAGGFTLQNEVAE